MTSSKNIAHLFFQEICTVWRVNALVHSVKVSNQGAVYFFLNVLYHSALETKVLCHYRRILDMPWSYYISLVCIWICLTICHYHVDILWSNYISLEIWLCLTICHCRVLDMTWSNYMSLACIWLCPTICHNRVDMTWSNYMSLVCIWLCLTINHYRVLDMTWCNYMSLMCIWLCLITIIMPLSCGHDLVQLYATGVYFRVPISVYIGALVYLTGGRIRLPKLKFSGNFLIGLITPFHVILQIHCTNKNFKNA